MNSVFRFQVDEFRMIPSPSLLRRGIASGFALAILIALSGCDAPKAHFATNKTWVRKTEQSFGVEVGKGKLQQVTNALTALFGTPDQPIFYQDSEAGTADFVVLDRLVRAAGPVTGYQRDDQEDASLEQLARGEGLYRQHCVHCHGITGNGKGPTAQFLNPYPRDFTMGKFKFKSTPKGLPPTADNLELTLRLGIEGTAMPSFALLKQGEIDALVDYVKYLSMRGLVERRLIEDAAELEEGEKLDTSRDNLVLEKLGTEVAKWEAVAPSPVAEPHVPIFTMNANWTEAEEKELMASIRRGRDLYYGGVANCFSCHGTTQLGDGQATDYDDWTKELYDWPNVPANEKEEKTYEYLSLGGLQPRNILPRNLRLGQYRGGRRPIDIYWRVLNGIEGAPMPAATLKPEGAGPEVKGLTTDDIWDIVNFVFSLPYDRLSRPGLEEVTNQRILP